MRKKTYLNNLMFAAVTFLVLFFLFSLLQERGLDSAFPLEVEISIMEKNLTQCEILGNNFLRSPLSRCRLINLVIRLCYLTFEQ